ncbi:hypothetical protein GOP47_0014728 [Adiantum capillus-veneris]|uniref:PRA1 family protein n=1 Tax=Adiantum capillus-veneris TaxID=13818 RepID=A0A9D4UM96_ADICA|nr:hypothetical protein GOP47_0014728 [Adiantum capillus-veneris]
MATPETISAAGVSTALGSATPSTRAAAARAFLGRISENWQQALSQSRPWRELVDRTSFGKPDSLSDATSRIRKNVAHFRLNYALIFTAVLALTLLSNPFSLFLLCGLLAAWIFMFIIRTAPLILFNRTFSEREALALMGLLSIVVIFMTNVGSVLISAAMLGAAVICVHAAFRVPDDLFLDDDVPASGGLLSFLSTGPSPPPIASHV